MAEITVASTTDTQDTLNRVAGANAAEESEVQTAEGEEPEQAEHAEPQKPAESKSHYQKRIDKLTREKYELRNQFQTLAQRLEALEKSRNGQEPAKEAAKPEAKAENAEPPRPKQEEFKTFEEWQEADDDWRIERGVRKRMAEAEKVQAQRDAQEAAQKAKEAFSTAMEEARERYDDWDDVVSRDRDIPEVVGQVIVEQGLTDLMYYLGKHPEVCKELMGMTPAASLVKIGQIQMALEPVESQEPSSAPVPKIKSRAAEPIRPVSGNSTKSSVPIDELPYNEFRKIRDRQEQERYRR